MIKGGYKIIDFKGTELGSTAVEISGIYNQIVDDYNKPIMVSGVSISGELQDDAYASVSNSEDGLTLTVYDGVITVTDDDEVTFTSAMSNVELAEEINDLIDGLESKEWTAQIYDAETYKRDVTGLSYFKIGGLYIMLMNGNFDFSDISTMLQIRNLPCAKCIGGTAYFGSIKSEYNLNAGVKVQGYNKRAYFRPNVNSAMFDTPENVTINQFIFFGV